ncbi:hypothetical protein [Methylobacterium segetis]|uniref:hypothetical protein n=1 Tax=Methylobacterium segetis TaxID=2488750 RepID=UPI001052F75C|nr:hypothetical protein [Methylobacterium segetis]
MKYFLAAAFAAATLSGASAHSRLDAHVRPPAEMVVADEAIGAAPDVAVGFGGAGEMRDLQGRPLSNSARGNAQFPERPAAAQNLGGTSGGPAY